MNTDCLFYFGDLINKSIFPSYKAAAVQMCALKTDRKLCCINYGGYKPAHINELAPYYEHIKFYDRAIYFDFCFYFEI